MSCIAIITARGGSKRIPQKNIKVFCGKPIIAYSIEAALEAKIFDEVMVSTDSEEIKEVAMSYGASVPFLRSESTSDDFATTADVIEEVLIEYSNRGQLFDTFCCIYPTAPFITYKKLREAMQEINKADAVVSVVRYSYPPQRAFVLHDKNLEYQYPQFERTRSQDLEPIYHDCGQFYICNVSGFLKNHSLILPRTHAYVINEEEVQDIDTESDWRIAEMKYRLLNETLN